MGAPGLLDILESESLREEGILSSLLGESAAPPAPQGAHLERLADALRVGEVRDRFREADAAPEGRDGEAARSRFRLLSREFLARETAHVRAEMDAVVVGNGERAGDRFTQVALAGEPEGRKRAYGLWEEEERRLLPLRHDLLDETERLARDAGADGALAFLGATEPSPAAGVALAFTRAAVAPLDEAIAASARLRRARFRPPFRGAEQPSEVPPLSILADHAARLPSDRVVATLRGLLAHLGEDPDGRGPRLLQPARPLGRSLVLEHARPRPAVVVATLGGPGGLASSLRAAGRAIRASFLHREEDPAVVAALDPAFGAAAGTLFTRLALSESFREWCGLSMDADSIRDLRFETSLLPRAHWARLTLSLEAEPGGDGTAEVLRRATGRDALPEDRAASFSRDPSDASSLRGIVLGALLEDRLMTRFGRLWFLDRAAARFLKECFRGEAGETAESMAGTLGLGTIEPTPIVDVFRP